MTNLSDFTMALLDTFRSTVERSIRTLKCFSIHTLYWWLCCVWFRGVWWQVLVFKLFNFTHFRIENFSSMPNLIYDNFCLLVKESKSKNNLGNLIFLIRKRTYKKKAEKNFLEFIIFVHKGKVTLNSILNTHFAKLNSNFNFNFN